MFGTLIASIWSCTTTEHIQKTRYPRSWKRSAANYKIDPDSDDPPRILTTAELKDYREKADRLIAIARDELDSLYRIVWRARYVLLLSNERGVTIDHRGEPTEAARFSYWGTWIGGVWSEGTEGTNGIGMCIAEARPVTVHRTQHFRSRHVNLSCSVAPIFGIRGELIGTLDISSIDPNLSEQSRGLAESLVIETARAIQERYFREQFRGHWIVAVAEPDATDGAILLAVDKDHQIVAQTAMPVSCFREPTPFWTARSIFALCSNEMKEFSEQTSTQAILVSG
jgi:transcriptional regulator of acetoin/glycerol metabolism